MLLLPIGLINEGLKKRGPKGNFTKEQFSHLSRAYISYVAITQSSKEADANSVAIMEMLKHFLKDSEFSDMSIRGLYNRLKKENAAELYSEDDLLVELRRQLWTTGYNLEAWFINWEKFCVDNGFATRELVVDDNGAPILDDNQNQQFSIQFTEEQLRRIMNLDETCISLDGSKGKAGGRPPNVVYVTKAKRAGTPSNKAGKSATLLAGSAADGSTTPIVLILPSDASPENARITADVFEGLPYAKGRFGHDEEKDFAPSVNQNERGGMDADGFKKIMTTMLTTLYPDMADIPGKRVLVKIDGGPGRLDADMLIGLRAAGVYLYPTVPNATAVMQETDRSYGVFVSLLRRALKTITAEAIRGGTTLNASHYSILINGRPKEECTGDELEIKSPFATAFSREKNLDSWAKIGAAPATRACLTDEKVRPVCVDPEWIKALEEQDLQNNVTITAVHSHTDVFMDQLKEYGQQNLAAVKFFEGTSFNAEVFRAVLPETELERRLGESEAGSNLRVARLSKNLGSHSKRFCITMGEPLNSDDALRAIEFAKRKEDYDQAKREYKSAKELFDYQDKALQSLAARVDVAAMNKKQLLPLVKFGIKRVNMRAALTSVVNLPIAQLRTLYASDYQEAVENALENDRFTMPADIAEPSVPNAEETILARKGREGIQLTTSSLKSCDDPEMDMPVLVALKKAVDEKLASQVRGCVWDALCRLDAGGEIEFDQLCSNIPERDAVRFAVRVLVGESKAVMIGTRVRKYVAIEGTVPVPVANVP